jgi:hypothetical protein
MIDESKENRKRDEVNKLIEQVEVGDSNYFGTQRI